MASRKEYTEQELQHLTAEDDREAFTELLHRFWNKVYTQAVTWLKSPQQAQEITQDIFVIVWQEREKLREVQHLSAWLSAITRNKVSSELRKPGRRMETVETLTAHSDHGAEQRLLYKETYSVLQKGIAALPPARKRVFIMSRDENKSYDEIARELNISRNGVKDHIVRALNFLRKYLETHAGGASLAIFLISEFLKKKS